MRSCQPTSSSSSATKNKRAQSHSSGTCSLKWNVVTQVERGHSSMSTSLTLKYLAAVSFYSLSSIHLSWSSIHHTSYAASKIYGVNATIIIFVFVLYCIVLYCIVLYCIMLYCIVLFCFVLYYIVLFCIVL